MRGRWSYRGLSFAFRDSTVAIKRGAPVLAVSAPVPVYGDRDDVLLSVEALEQLPKGLSHEYSRHVYFIEW
jgi:hypothetical protein